MESGGPGEAGDQLAPGNVDEGPGQGEGAGSDAGEHSLEVDVTIEELAQMLGEGSHYRELSRKVQSR